MKAKQHIQKIIGQHREKVAQLFDMYGIDLPLTVQNVLDVLYIKGKEFQDLFWNLDTVSFTGNSDSSAKPFSDPATDVKDNSFVVVIGVAIIIVLTVIVFLTRKKDGK